MALPGAGVPGVGTGGLGDPTSPEYFQQAVGDRVLSAIGEALAKTCDGHIVSRHGGEEFAILLAGCDLASAAALLDAARAEVLLGLADERLAELRRSRTSLLADEAR